MELDGGDFLRAMADAGDGSIIQMTMGHFQIGWQSLLLHGIAVILGRDKHPSRAEILHGLIGSTMSEFQFEGLGTEGQ